MEFRKDINGLRAWAVSLVLLYHFGVPGFSGGFIGVDVFFVISGFLMTKIILGGQSRNDFSLWSFYLSRARRILPALAMLVIVLLFMGWFWLSALDYRTLAKHGLASILFVSNFVFKNEAGYFDAASHEKWLLHTWSLSVEWQFYLVFPLFLMLIRRFLPRAAGIAMAVVLAASLGISTAQTSSSSSVAAFFLLPARAWEMLAGGLVCIYGERLGFGPKSRPWLEWTGFGLVLISAMALADSSRWPGAMAILPVAGAVLVMLAARVESPLTSTAPTQAIGKWSYSVYLWHWPVFVGASYLGMAQDSTLKLALILVSMFMGYLSFRFVEEPVRHARLGRRARWRAMLAVASLVIVPAAWISENRGVPKRLPDAVAAIEAEALNKKSIMPKCGWDPEGAGLPECRFGAVTTQPNVAVWGDSHALASMPAMGDMAKRANRALVLYNENSCPPILGAIRDNPSRSRDCRDFNQEVLSRIRANQSLDTVIFMARWSVYLVGSNETNEHPYVIFPDAPLSKPELRVKRYSDQLVQTLCEVARIKRVYAVAPLPEFGAHVPKAMVRSLLVDGRATAPRISMNDYRSRNQAVLAALDQARLACGVEVLDPTPLFCPGDRCDGAFDGLPVYFDDDHPGMRGNQVLAPLFFDVFRNTLTDKGHP